MMKTFEVTMTVRAYGPSPEKVLESIQKRLALPAPSEESGSTRAVVVEPTESVQIKRDKSDRSR